MRVVICLCVTHGENDFRAIQNGLKLILKEYSQLVESNYKVVLLCPDV